MTAQGHGIKHSDCTRRIASACRVPWVRTSQDGPEFQSGSRIRGGDRGEQTVLRSIGIANVEADVGGGPWYLVWRDRASKQRCAEASVPDNPEPRTVRDQPASNCSHGASLLRPIRTASSAIVGFIDVLEHDTGLVLRQRRVYILGKPWSNNFSMVTHTPARDL
jgi:hypothetical protein